MVLKVPLANTMPLSFNFALTSWQFPMMVWQIWSMGTDILFSSKGAPYKKAIKISLLTLLVVSTSYLSKTNKKLECLCKVDVRCVRQYD